MKHLVKNFKKLALFLTALLSVGAIAFAPPVLAETSDTSGTDSSSSASTGLNAKKQACDGLDAVGTTDCGGGTGVDVPKLIGTVINILTIIVGAVSVIMIIIGGFRYVISNGDSNSVSGAKNTILYAVVGLVIALSAQLIVAFVINKS